MDIQMIVQWIHLPDRPMHILHQYIGEEDWQSYNLSSVSRNWWMTDDRGETRYELGTIVLTPQGIPREHFEPIFGKTFGAIVGLINHSEIHKISNNHYKFVELPEDISSFEPITDQALGLLLLLMWNLGQRLQYKNVTALDLSDTSQWAVDDDKYQAADMVQTDLFWPQIPLRPVNGGSLATYLFRWFFPNVTSVNLSRTTWTDSATTEITFATIKELIWTSSYITTDLFLSPLLVSTQLVVLHLDNSTILLPWTEQTHPVHWRDIGRDGDMPYNVFANLVNCTNLQHFSCSKCRLKWSGQRANDVLLIEPLPGHFCSQWLIRMAPLSLQSFNGPIYKHDVTTVIQRFDLHFLLTPNPIDYFDYYYDESDDEEEPVRDDESDDEEEPVRV